MTGGIVAVAALLQWLFFWSRMVFRRDNRPAEIPFLVSTVAMAIVWAALAAPVSVAQHQQTAALTLRKGGCAQLTTGLPSATVRAKMGAPTRTVSEGDSRGPGAEAWVYEEARCVAHVVNDRVRAVDYE